MTHEGGGPGARYVEALPARVELAVGERFEQPVPSAAAGGYLWKSVLRDGDAGTATVAFQTGALLPADPPTSAAAPVTLVALGHRPGTSRWEVQLARPWGTDAPLAAREMEVVVRSDP